MRSVVMTSRSLLEIVVPHEYRCKSIGIVDVLKSSLAISSLIKIVTYPCNHGNL